jgi:hypothetical protein
MSIARQGFGVNSLLCQFQLTNYKMAGCAGHFIVSYQLEPVPVRQRGVQTPLSRTGREGFFPENSSLHNVLNMYSSIIVFGVLLPDHIDQ